MGLLGGQNIVSSSVAGGGGKGWSQNQISDFSWG